MKKIVALVLCLVLALSLCTVAFASFGDDGQEYSIVTVNQDETDASTLFDKDSVTIVDAKDPVRDTHGNVKYVTWNDYTNTKYAAVVAVDDAEYKIIDKNGKAIAYLADDGTTGDAAAALAAMQYDYAPKAFTKLGDDCDEITKNGDTKFYTWVNDDGDVCYGADASQGLGSATGVFLIDGELTTLWTAELNGHFWTVVYDKDDEATGLKCADCGNYYVEAANLSVKGAVDPADYGAYKAGEDDDAIDYIVYTATTDSTTTVESAKTFDAGIALYAGMALASVAGSAVVIGKKKEF